MRSPEYKIVPDERRISRRLLLQFGALGALSAAIPSNGFAAVRRHLRPERSLAFHNLHTGEHLKVTYCVKGKYRQEALARIDHILRDHRTGEIKAIDTRLLNLLYALAESLDARAPFHVISGYRSPKTNAMLRAGGRAVAGKSLHLEGKAVDIRLPGRELPVLRRAAVEMNAGGVGYYPVPDFVHIDVGRVRQW